MWMNVLPKKIFVTGGASNNLTLLQIMANVMNASVLRIHISNSAVLGAALIAAHGWYVRKGEASNWEKWILSFSHPDLESEIHPDKNAVKIYDNLLDKYARCEKMALENK
jgi:xylulokinase